MNTLLIHSRHYFECIGLGRADLVAIQATPVGRPYRPDIFQCQACSTAMCMLHTSQRTIPKALIRQKKRRESERQAASRKARKEGPYSILRSYAVDAIHRMRPIERPRPTSCLHWRSIPSRYRHEGRTKWNVLL